MPSPSNPPLPTLPNAVLVDLRIKREAIGWLKWYVEMAYVDLDALWN